MMTNHDGFDLLAPANTVQAPWSSEQVYRLNLRQGDSRVASYQCPWCDTDLYATRDGWICAKNHCRFRDDWAHDRHINHPFVPPPRTGS